MLYDGFACEGYELAPDAPLVTALLGAAERATGRRPPLFASTATTDARSFQLYGDTPAVCFGPVAESEHGVDERVHLPSVTETAQAIALFIRDWCGLTGRSAAERQLHGALGVQAGRVEHGDGRVAGPDEQVDLGAAEQDALGAAAGELAHDPPVLGRASDRRPRRRTARRR